jgi:hypothetical protein
VVSRFAEVGFERRLELRRRGLFDHLRQRANDSFFRVVDILELVDEQVVHCPDVLGENAHLRVPWLAWIPLSRFDPTATSRPAVRSISRRPLPGFAGFSLPRR